MKAENNDWPGLLEQPGADRYVYRLMNNDGHPVGKWGPSVVFTLKQAKGSAFQSVIDAGGAHWVRAGTLLYSVE